LAVGEGLETCASFQELEGVVTWAALGTANLEAFTPPTCVRHLIIAADGDAAGMKAANALATRLRNRCDVTISPAPPGSDWNDVATGKAYV
jgi:putative DNA primase/helicase